MILRPFEIFTDHFENLSYCIDENGNYVLVDTISVDEILPHTDRALNAQKLYEPM